MKKQIFPAICLIFLSACNLTPIKSGPPSGAISTSVAQTLTVHASTKIPKMEFSPTSHQDITSKTLQPEITISPMPTHSATPTATVDPIMVISGTPTPVNPEIPQGPPTRQLSLENGKAFGITGEYQDDAGNSISVAGGFMTLHNPNYNGFLVWRLTTVTSNNFYIEAVFQTKSCAGSDEYGITVRAPDYLNGYGYYFGATCDGNILLTRRDENGISTVIAASPSNQINPGNNQENHLGILAEGNKFRLYANAKFLQEAIDSGIPAGGHYGPYIIGRSGNNTVNLDEISYWSLP